MTPFDFWSTVSAARSAGATKVHLRPDVPPLMRGADRRLAPVFEEETPVSEGELMAALSVLVDPERWGALEHVGEGEVLAPSPQGEFTRLTLFRSEGRWNIVAHLH